MPWSPQKKKGFGEDDEPRWEKLRALRDVKEEGKQDWVMKGREGPLVRKSQEESQVSNLSTQTTNFILSFAP